MKIDNSQASQHPAYLARDGHKTCYTCCRYLLLTDFHKDASKEDGLSYNCKACRSAQAKTAYTKHREKKKAYAKAYHAIHRPDYLRRMRDWRSKLSKAERKDLDLRKTHGITLAQMQEMHKQQDGRCKICLRIPSTPLVVDHCHSTKKIRGLLCQACNSAIGKLQESESVMLRAIAYVKGELSCA